MPDSVGLALLCPGGTIQRLVGVDVSVTAQPPNVVASGMLLGGVLSELHSLVAQRGGRQHLLGVGFSSQVRVYWY